MAQAKSAQQNSRSKSVLKRQRQTISRYQHNRSQKSAFRTELKKVVNYVQLVNASAKGTLKEEIKVIYTSPKVHKLIDVAHSKGLISKNTASRYKSRYDVLLANVDQPPTTKSATTANDSEAAASTTDQKAT